jgi:hypothetical protein
MDVYLYFLEAQMRSALIMFVAATSFFIAPVESHASKVSISPGQISDMTKYFKLKYALLLEALREGCAVKRSEIAAIYKNDPMLNEEKAKSGYRVFSHIHFPMRVSVVNHGKDEVDAGERAATHKALQVYLNAVKVHIIQASGKKLEEQAKAYSLVANTPGAWQKLYDYESKQYDWYIAKK